MDRDESLRQLPEQFPYRRTLNSRDESIPGEHVAPSSLRRPL